MHATLNLNSVAHLPRWLPIRGAATAAAISLCFVVAELAQVYLTNSYGWLAGGAAAGLVLFTLSPLQRAVERAGHTKICHAPRMATSSEAIYRAQIVFAWADGRMTVRERVLLDQLRDSLGLSAEAAAAIEREALSR